MISKIIKQLSIIIFVLVLTLGVVIINPKSTSLKYGFDKPALNAMYENQQCSIPFKQGDWTDYCNIKKFNPQDGILKNVKITMQASTKSEVKLENLNVVPVNFNVSSTVNLVIIDSNSNELINNQVKASKDYSLDKYDGITDYTGKSGTVDNSLVGAKTEKINVFGDLPRMSGFIKNDANDSVSKSIIVKSQGNVNSTNNMDSKIITQTEVNVIKFQYEYVVGDLAITKFHEPSIFEKGKIAQVKLKVTNLDSDPTEGTITVVDKLPAFLQYVSQDNADWICTTVNNLECKYTKSIAPKADSYLVINVKILDSAPKNYVNTATVSYDKKEYDYANNTATDTIEFGISPKNPAAIDCNLGLTDINQSFVIDTKVSNCLTGTDPDGDVTVVKFMIKTLPDPTKGKLQYNNQDIPLNFVVTQGNQNKLTFVPFKDYCGKYNFTYTAIDETNLEDLTPAEVIGEIKCQQPTANTKALDDLEIIKYTEGKFIENIWAKYIIRVKNTKDVEFKGTYTVKDQLPKGVMIVKIKVNSGWDCTKSLTQSLDCTYSGLMFGKQEEFITFDVMPQTNSFGLITNTAYLTTVNGEDNLDNNKASVESYITQQVIPQPATQNKSVAQAPVTPPKPIVPDTKPVIDNIDDEDIDEEEEDDDEEEVTADDVKAVEKLTRTGGYYVTSIVTISFALLIVGLLTFRKLKK
jgi:uncharacterized protein YcnI